MSSFRRQNNKQSFLIPPITSSPPLKKRKISSESSKSLHFPPDSDSNSSPSPSPPITNELTSYIKNGIEPWWIGQHITVKTISQNIKKQTIINKTASIRDYNPFTKLTHIWFEKDGHFEDINLLNMDAWNIKNNKIKSQLKFIPNNNWIPIYYKVNEYVLVKSDCNYDYGKQIIGIIDGYDPISRRHHIKYNGGQISEWLWATKKRVKIYKNKKNIKTNSNINNINFILPPPWNPIPYGLDETFAIKSKEIEENRWKKSQKRINESMHMKQKRNMEVNSCDKMCETSDLYEAAQILCALKYFRQ